MAKNIFLKKNILCLIPARGGSIGIKNKNILKVKKKEIINYTIEVSMKLKNYCDIVISTDSKKIFSKCKSKENLIFNGLRPKYLSGPNSLTKDVVRYELKKTQKILKKKYKYILLLQPTCPIRDYKKILKCFKIIKKGKFDSILSISNVNGNHPFRMKVKKKGLLKNFMNFKNENMVARQKLPKVYIRSGSIYLTTVKSFLKHDSLVGKKCYGIELFGDETINIDTKQDLEYFKYRVEC